MTQYVINIGALPNDGTGDPLRTAFNDVNLNFNQVWAAGLVNSNIQIANNTILTTNTNGNLILNPNGVGSVIANAHVLPDQTRIRNLGSSTLRWDTIYAQYVDIGGTLTIAGDLSVNGNLSVTGNIIEVGNIITDAKTIQLANTAGTANAANGSGITVGANDNIATFLYNSTNNAWVTNVGFETGNLILTDDRIMDLSGPSITNADLISGSTSGLDIVPNGDANATVLYNTYGNIQLQTSDTGSNVKVFQFGYDGNLSLPSSVSAVGNITADYFIGNGSQLTGINTVSNKIINGTSNVDIPIANGNVSINTNSTHTWNFDTSGNLLVPANTWINTPSGDGNIGFHLNGNGAVVIQGSAPVLLSLKGDVANTLNRIEVDTIGFANTLGGTFTGTFTRGSVGSPAAVLTNDRLASLKGRGYDGLTIVPPTGQITIDAFDDWQPGNTPTRLSFWTTGYGCSTPILNMQVDPDGNVNVYNGNLIVTGGGGYLQGNTISGDGGLYAGVPGFTILGSNVVAQFAGNANSYSQINFENTNSGSQASGDFIITADNGDDLNNFIDLGIAGSGWDGSQENSLGNALSPNDGYLYVNGGNLTIGTVTLDGNLNIAINTWRFDTSGNLTLPANTFNVNYANGTAVTLGGAGTYGDSNVVTLLSNFGSNAFSTTGNIQGGNIITSGNISGNVNGYAVGYRDIPQVLLSANTTITTSDAGKHYYANSINTFTWTVANNASQAFQIGATINLINKGTGNVNILQDSGVSLYLAGNATTGNRVLTSYGVASITKVETDTWFISGVGLV